MMQNKRAKKVGKRFLFAFLFLFLLVGTIFSIVPKVWADPVVTEVLPGAGTLQQAVLNANPGDTLKLKAGSYTGGGTDKTVTIDKELTILGEGGLRSSTVIDVPLVVKTSSKVKLANFSSSSQTVEPNFVFIKTVGKVNLEIENAYIWGIFRGTNFPIHNATVIEVTKGSDVTSSSDKVSDTERSQITVKNSLFVKPMIYRGISIEASNTTMNLYQTEVTGRVAVSLADGKHNVLNVLDNSSLEGLSNRYADNEVVQIQNQQDLTFHVDHSTIIGNVPKGNIPSKIISFSEEKEKSTNVKIELQNESQIIDEDEQNAISNTSSAIHFRSDSQASDNNVVTVDKSSGMYLSILSNKTYQEVERKLLDVSRKYSQVTDGAVIGIYDSDRNGTIQVYDNDSVIEELTQEKYIKKEGFKFKGWFKTFENDEYSNEYQKVGESYPLAVQKTNMDLYVKLAEILQITIKNTFGSEGTYQIEKGQTISESDDSKNIKDALEQVKIKEGQEFRGFVIYNSHGNLTYEPEREKDLTDKLRMTEDCTIEAIHQVKVTINGEEFYIAAGETLKDIKNQDAQKYEEAKMKNSVGRTFSRFVRKDTDETVSEEEGIPVNTELVSKYFYQVTIDGTSYQLEEGLTLNSSEEIKEALKKISPEVKGRSFSKFVEKEDSEKKKIDPDKDKISKDLELDAIYTIRVHLLKAGEPKDYIIEAGSNLKSLKQDSDVLSSLDSVSENLEAGKNFAGFVATYDEISMDSIVFDSKSTPKETLEQQVLDQAFEYNVTIYVRSNIEVKINGVPFTMNSGESLKTAILDQADEDLKEEYRQAKYGEKEEKRFYKFVVEGDKTEKEVTEEDVFESSTTLISKYFVFITIDDARENVGGTYKLEENTLLDDLVEERGKNALTTLRNDIVASKEGEKENLHFEKLVNQNNEPIEEDQKVQKDMTIKGLYHYDVTVVRDYDNPVYDAHGVQGLKVYRNQTLKTIETDLKKALEELEASVNQNEKRKFYSYVEENTEREFSNVEDILNEAFNTHLYIQAKIAHKVKIGSVEDYVVEGGTLKESSKLLEALDKLKNDKEKEVSQIIVNGKAYEKDEVTGDTVIDGYTEISATYQAKVTINGEEYFLPLGGKLSDLSERQTEIDAALAALEQQVTNDGYHFKGYYVDGESTVFDKDSIKEQTFSKNVTINAKYNIQVSIQGATYTKTFYIETDDTLEQVKAFNPTDYQNVTKKENRTFLHFVVDDTDKTILKDNDTKYHFTKNTTLTAVFAVTVKIGSEDYLLKEGEPLSSDTDIVAALKGLEKKDKTLVSYSTDKGDTISVEELNNQTDIGITDNITITPKYMITVEIEDGEVFKTVVDEHTKLKDIPYQKPEKFRRFEDALTKEEVDEEQELTKNTKLKVIYGITVTVNEHEYQLDSFQTFADLKKIHEAEEDLKELEENIPSGKSSFSRFIYENEKNEKIEVKDDTIFTKDTIILPKYKVEVTVTYLEEEKEEELIKLELEEDTTLSELSNDELELLNQKLQEVEEQLEQAGKHNFKFSKFVLENGEEVDIQTTMFNKATTIKAIFEYKKESTPVEPSNPNDYPYQEQAPNTGIKNSSSNIDMVITVITFVLMALSGGMVVYKKKESRN